MVSLAWDEATGAFVPVEAGHKIVDVVLTLDTAIYANGDLLADTQVITDAVSANGGATNLISVGVLDEDDQGTAIALIFLATNVSLGTENAAPSITDANARQVLGKVDIAAADFTDLGGCRFAAKSAVNMLLKADAASRNLYVAAVVASGTPTYTVNGLRLKLGFKQ